jgi:DHA3 family macrolide efflux protein-like MFS transporter
MEEKTMEVTQQPVSIWKNKTFLKMFSAYSISTFGDWFDLIAISVLVAYRWQTDPILIGMIPVMYALPGILFGSFSGVVADRWKKLNLMIIADLLVAVLTLILMFAPNIYWVLPILMLRATLGVFNIPAQQALTRQVVAEDQLLKATSMNGLVNQMSKVAGPLLGAAVLIVITPQLCILLNAITRLISAMILFTIRGIKENLSLVEKGEENQAFRQLWKEGWGLIFKRKLLFHTMIFGFFGLMAIQLVDFQFPTLFRDFAPHNESLIGWTISASGLGAVMGITWVNRLKNVNYGWVLGGGYLLIGVGFGWIGWLEPGMREMWAVMAGLIMGFGNGIWMVGYNFLIQMETPKEAIGRVFGIQNTISSFVAILAPLTGGVLIQIMGVAEVFIYVGWIIALIGLIGIVFKNVVWPTESKGNMEQS